MTTGICPRKLQEAVTPYLTVPTFQQKWVEYQGTGSGYYYALTYPSILSFYRDHGPLCCALNLKVALVYSWNPTICKVKTRRFTAGRRQLASLESCRKQLAGKSLLSVHTDAVIEAFWTPLKKVTSLKDSHSGVSVTKFLHFTFPHIFPMIDLDAMKKLGPSAVDQKPYTSFVSEWKNLYRDHQQCLDQISTAVGMPVARVLDVMIFTPKKRKQEGAARGETHD